jgi:hypothetical protein
MGLDMYANVYTPEGAELILNGDFVYDDLVPHIVETNMWYWRKHHSLHGWMQRLYARKTGIDAPDEFNCVYVELTEIDLYELSDDIDEDRLTPTEGFFFGHQFPYTDEDKVDDFRFIEKAREHIKDGNRVFYTSWW